MSNRSFYEKLFADYRDVVSFKDLQAMLGGLSLPKTRRLLEEGQIKSFFIGNQYKIPKLCIIDFLVGDHSSAKRIDAAYQGEGKRRKPGTGCLYQINDHLWEGKYSPRDAYGRRISKNVYGKTKAECERKLKALITRINKDILDQKITLMREKCSEAYVRRFIDDQSKKQIENSI